MNKRVLDSMLVLGVNLISLGLGLLPYPWMVQAGIHPFLAALISDVTATVLVYLAGLLLKTPSAYDPYWSLQTIAIYGTMIIYNRNFTWWQLLIFVPLLYYSCRLTIHFFGTFHGLDYIDWRYANFKEAYPKAFPLISLFGIHMFPTLVVFGASLPILAIAFQSEFTPFAIVSCVLADGAVTLSLIADLQMKHSRKNRKSNEEVNAAGLWQFSRHPNYLGEISFWWSFLFLLFALPNYWWMCFGAVIVLALFLFYSIPAIEKRMIVRKPGYLEYKKHVSMLLLLPPRK